MLLGPGLFDERGGLGRKPHQLTHSGDPKQQTNTENTAFKGKIGQGIRQKKLLFDVFDVFRRFSHVFDVLEAREALQKLPGGDTLRFHRI